MVYRPRKALRQTLTTWVFIDTWLWNHAPRSQERPTVQTEPTVSSWHKGNWTYQSWLAFWSGIWSEKVSHYDETPWQTTLSRSSVQQTQEDIFVTVEEWTNICGKMRSLQLNGQLTWRRVKKRKLSRSDMLDNNCVGNAKREGDTRCWRSFVCNP